MNFCSKNMFLPAALALVFAAGAAVADVCDYRPSALLGSEGAADAAIVAGGTVAASGGIGTAAGFYTLVHATSGLTMLGSTAAGASAAGTVGIIAGTGGILGAVGAVVLNPLVWIPAAVATAGAVGVEGYCMYAVDERITDFDEVMSLLRDFEANAQPEYFKLNDGKISPSVSLSEGDGKWVTYDVEDLYIVNGILKHRDFMRDTVIGRIIYVQAVPKKAETAEARE